MARIGAPADYTKPCPGEIAKLGRRYSKTRGGNPSRTWRPSKQRIAAVRAIVFGRDDYTCQLCGHRPECAPDDWYGLHLDHIIPYRDGGLFYPDNLQTLCEPCNCRKGARV
jgi:5-methylcytosine-specific restriction endonuclease McrA